tara:strand:- start:463 stop:582 length:120 start_codon:yes stop_codon:yes gene_type:complete
VIPSIWSLFREKALALEADEVLERVELVVLWGCDEAVCP